MGQTSSSLANDPSTYATPFVPRLSNVVTEDEWTAWMPYDYVIIGGGSAGCVLAARLSEDRNTSVILLEAGERHEGKLYSRIPLAFKPLLGSAHDWSFLTTPQRQLFGRTVEMPRGKILGGTSAINALIYHQCDPEDFDAWERQGGIGWSWKNMKPYFDKARNDGPRVCTDLPIAPITEAYLEAAKTLGISLRKSFNTSEGTAGAGSFHGAIDEKHERSSTATSYLSAEVLRRPNLTVAASVYTERILFSPSADGSGVRAVGAQVSASRDGPKFAVGATREVIVCGGVFGSPQLLLLSGLGPADHLGELNIPVVRDLPAVGRGLKDHISAGTLVFRAKAGQTLDYIPQSQLRSALGVLRWLLFGTGPFSGLVGQAAIFTRSDDKSLPYGPRLPVMNTASGSHSPDLEFLLFPMSITDYTHGNGRVGESGITVGIILLKPVSEGNVKLCTNSVYDHPLIDPNFLAEESDLNMLIRSVRFLLRLARTAPLCHALDLRSYETAPKDADYYWIGDADPEKVSDEEIELFIRRHAQSATHPTSSARMGSDLETSVVDPELRVHGIQGLRVVDASVFPDQVSGHPCVPVIALAERAADLIKGFAHSV